MEFRRNRVRWAPGAWNSSGRNSGSRVLAEAARLRAVAAAGHVAPAARVIPRAVEERPAAGRRAAELEPLPVGLPHGGEDSRHDAAHRTDHARDLGLEAGAGLPARPCPQAARGGGPLPPRPAGPG